MTAASASDADRRALAIVAAFAGARLALALTLGFGNDETYTLVMSRQLALSYFDHPPLHQWITHFAALALGETAWTRLPFVGLFAATGGGLYLLTRDLFSPRAGLIALFALNVTPYFFASPGEWIVPDGALLFGLTAAALSLSRALFGGPDARGAWALWLAGGICLGLAGLSKYSAMLFVVGLLAFLAISPAHRRWWLHPAPYAAAALSAVIVSPVVVWNAEHGWASFVFQGVRATSAAKSGPGPAAAMALGEIAYLTPWIFAGLVGAILAAARTGRGDAKRLFLLCLALPPILIFTLTPLWGERGIPHWAMPGWFFAYPLLGAWLDQPWGRRLRLRRWAAGSAIFLGVLASLVVIQTRTGWMRTPSGAPDPTLELASWRPVAEAIEGGPRADFVVATDWPSASKVALALGPGAPVLLMAGDQRGWVAFNDSAGRIGEDAMIVSSRARLPETLALATSFFTSLEAPRALSFGRGGRRELEFALIQAHGLTRAFPVPYPR